MNWNERSKKIMLYDLFINYTKHMEQMTFIEKAITTLVIAMACIGILWVPVLLNRTNNLWDLATVLVARLDQLSGASANHDTRLWEVQSKVASMEYTLVEYSGSLSFLDERRKDMMKQLNQSEIGIRAILINKYNCTGDLYYANTYRTDNETNVTSLLDSEINDLFISDRQYDREILCLDKLEFSKRFIRY